MKAILKLMLVMVFVLSPLFCLTGQTKIGISGYLYYTTKGKLKFSEWISCMPTLRVYSIKDKDIIYSETNFEAIYNYKQKTFSADFSSAFVPVGTRLAHISLHNFYKKFEIITQLNFTLNYNVPYNSNKTSSSFAYYFMGGNANTEFSYKSLQLLTGVSYNFHTAKSNIQYFVNTSYRYNFIVDRTPFSPSDDWKDDPNYYRNFVNYPTKNTGISEICLAFGKKIDNELIKGMRFCYDINNFKNRYFYAYVEFYRIMYINSIKKRNRNYYEKFD